MKAWPALALLLVSCSTSTAGGTGDRAPADVFTTSGRSDVRIANEVKGARKLIEASPDSVWAALSAVYQDLELEPDLTDPRTRRIGNQSLTRARIAGERTEALVSCAEGTGASAASRNRITLSIISQVEQEGAGSLLRTTISGTAVRADGTSVNRVLCYSKGVLEPRIFDAVADKLGIDTQPD
jgi:hypothetical protein